MASDARRSVGRGWDWGVEGVAVMDRYEAETVIRDYRALVDRAVAVVGGCPYHRSVEDETARLSIEGEMAALSWVSWDYECLDRDQCEFPVALLLIPDDEFMAWRAEREAEFQAQEKARKISRAMESVSRERAEYLRLRAKYGDAEVGVGRETEGDDAD